MLPLLLLVSTVQQQQSASAAAKIGIKITANVVPMNIQHSSILPNLEMKNTHITYLDTNVPSGTKYTFKNIYLSQMLLFFQMVM